MVTIPSAVTIQPPFLMCGVETRDYPAINVMQSDTDTLDGLRDKLQRWEDFLDEKREARVGAQGVRLEQIELEIAIIERICDDLSHLLDESLSDTDLDSGIAIFDRQGFAWMSNHHHPANALEEFDRAVGMDVRSKTLHRIAKNHTLFEIPEQDLPLWQDASVDDHPDTDGLRRVSL